MRATEGEREAARRDLQRRKSEKGQVEPKVLGEGYLYQPTHRQGRLVHGDFTTLKPTTDALNAGRVLSVTIIEREEP